MKRQHLLKIDAVIILLSVAVLFVFAEYSRPLVISPIDDFETLNNSVLFSFKNAEYLLIDDNPEFTSPEELYVKDNLVINLKPGIYYWKVKGFLQSSIRRIAVVSEVGLILRENAGDYEVVNTGNTKLELDYIENDSVTENKFLDIKESAEVYGDEIRGREYEA